MSNNQNAADYGVGGNEDKVLRAVQAKPKDYNISFGADGLRGCAAKLEEAANALEAGEFLETLLLMHGVLSWTDYMRITIHNMMYEGSPRNMSEPWGSPEKDRG